MPKKRGIMAIITHNLSSFLFDARRATLERKGDLELGFGPIRKILIEECSGLEVTLTASNGDTVNALHFRGTMDKAIIYLHGNGCFYETSASKPLRWLERIAETTDGERPHLFIFNPRGTGKSTGITAPDLVAEDFKLAFEYLVEGFSVNPDHVALSGHSMGGFFGAHGAARIQSLFPKNTINFLSDRSLSNLHDRVDIKVQNLGYSRISAFVVASSIHGTMSLLQWAKDPIEALEGLKGRVCIIYHKGDGVIPYKQSTHYALTQVERAKTYSCISLQEEGMAKSSAHAHNRDFTDEENTRIVVELKKMLVIPQTSEESLLFSEKLG